MIESLIAELGQATPNELKAFLAVVKEMLENTCNPTRNDALESILDSPA